MPVIIKAKENDVAKVVLLPGDPKRAHHIAKNFFSKAKLYTHERLMFGYTGFYKGYKISVQTTGIGIPSFAIIAEELKMLNVKSMIRVGTAGAIDPDLKINDLVIATSAHLTHPLWSYKVDYGVISPVADHNIVKMLENQAKIKDLNYYTGTVLTSIFLYDENEELLKKFLMYNTLAIEMETYALFEIGLRDNIKTGSIVVISDTLLEENNGKLLYKVVWADKKLLTVGINNMIELVLDAVVKNYEYLIK